MKPSRDYPGKPKRPSRLNLQTLGDVLAWDQKQADYIVPYFVPEEGNVIVTVAPGVDQRMFCKFVTYAVAARKAVEPFGIGAGIRVLYCSGAGDKFADEQQWKLIFDRDICTTSKDRALKNLELYNRDYEGDSPLFLDVDDVCRNHDMFLKLISRDTFLVVFDDIFSWIKDGRSGDCFENEALASFLAKLNERGVAVLMFACGGKKVVDLPAYSAFQSMSSLTYDAGAPRQFGGGFNVNRRKHHEEDPVPTSFCWWYTVIDGRLDFGWECRDQADKKTVNDIELMERRMKVEQLLAQGMNQKTIASLLDVNPATISRDVTKLKEGILEPKFDGVAGVHDASTNPTDEEAED